MEDLKIAGTLNSPLVEFSSTGSFKMQGRILTENAVNTFEPLKNWINDFEGSAIEFVIELDYINTSASMQLFSILRMLDENNSISDIKVRWFYEEDDEDHLETGEFYEDRLNRTRFEFVIIREKDVA